MKPSLARLLLALVLWGVAASIAGYFRLFLHLPPAIVPLLVATLTLAAAFSLQRIGWVRAAVADVGRRGLIGVHVIRFVGVAFLWLHAQGRLPAEFAQRAGWGDIATATGAVAFLVFPRVANDRRVFGAWNVFGALDLLVAVGTAGWLNLTRPGSRIELSALPFTLVPLWFVPVLLATHGLMLQQTFSNRGSSDRHDVADRDVTRRHPIGTQS
ncbi:MAG: hypothetical protein ABIZ04_08475 [Opitutus sp.]